MGGCQNYGPFLGTLNIRCRIILRTQKGTLILLTTHINSEHPLRLNLDPYTVLGFLLGVGFGLVVRGFPAWSFRVSGSLVGFLVPWCFGVHINVCE